MSLEEKISQLVHVRENWELGLKVVCEHEDVKYTSDGDGWRTRVVLMDDQGNYHCHRYQAWVQATRWEVWRDYIGSEPVKVMKWLCGVNVERDDKKEVA